MAGQPVLELEQADIPAKIIGTIKEIKTLNAKFFFFIHLLFIIKRKDDLKLIKKLKKISKKLDIITKSIIFVPLNERAQAAYSIIKLYFINKKNF
ncbi:hypothetical protein MASR1M65_21210 [Saprospiraceae bacterium]